MQKRCIHCLKTSDKITRDHVFPKSWYPESTPATTQRLTAPSCFDCNNTSGEIEKKLFCRLIPCISPEKQAIWGLRERFSRSLGIGISNGELPSEELLARKKLAVELYNELKPYTAGAQTFPGFGPHAGYPPETQMGIRIPGPELIAVSKKIVRGLEYVLNKKRYIEPPYELDVYFVEEGNNIAQVYTLLSTHGTKKEQGPGFTVERVAATTGTFSVIYRIIIWDTLVVYASIMTPDPD